MKNFVQREKKGSGDSLIHLGELAQWCDSRSTVPKDDDLAYVLHSYVPLEPDSTTFTIFMTTPRLLKLACLTTAVQIDATYQLHIHGYSVLVAGVSDRARVSIV